MQRRTSRKKPEWVISGVGLVTAAGNTLASLHAALDAGRPLRQDAPAHAPTIAMPAFQVGDYIQRRRLKDLSRTSQLACAAASFLAPGLQTTDPERIGIALGCGWGSLRAVVDFEWETCQVAPRHVDPLLFAETVPSVPAGQMAIIFGWSGAVLTVSSGGASGIEAIREGIVLMEEGQVSLTVVGGADEINEPVLRVLARDGLLATGDPSLPCGLGRSGITAGEGACLLALESRDSAAARGVQPLASVAGTMARFAGGNGGNRQGFVDLLGELLDEAELNPEEIDLVSMAADGSAADLEEATAVHEVFGEGPTAPLVIFPKAIVGETWAASGPLGAAAAMECMRTGRIPGRPQGLVPDPELPPLRIAARGGAANMRRALVLARSHGGHLAALLLEAGEL